jgi:hypothetical protein
MIQYTVKQGDCINSIADAHGFQWEKVWNHASNAEIRRSRKDPSVLNPGDVVHIPEKEARWENRSTDQRHKFCRKGVPAKVKIQINRNDEPRANEPYTLDIDGKLARGQTDGEGMVEMKIPPRAVRGELRVGTGGEMEIFQFRLGAVDSIDTPDGARQRLFNLGYDSSQESFEALLQSFQAKEQLQVTGQLDQATQDRLKQRFGE